MDTNNTNTSLLFSRLADSVRDKVEAKKLEINATVQEKLPEWKSRGQLYGNLARETGMEWSRKGKEAVDRWRKEFNPEKEYAPPLPARPLRSSTADSLGIFGMPLEQAVELTRSDQDAMVPAVVERCIKYLEQHGLKEVGIYRISGSQTALNKLRAVFDSGSNIDLDTVQPDAHVVSALLKMYLRELPEPIIPREIGDQYSKEITNALQDTDLDLPRMTPALIQSIRNITNQLPVYNQCLLQTLFRHLKHVADNHNENRMSTSNLAVVFIPTLGMGRVLFHCMIEHYQQIYKPPPPIPAKPQHVNRRFPTHQPKTRSDTDLMTMTTPSSTTTTTSTTAPNTITRIPPAKPIRKPKDQRERSKSVSTAQATPSATAWRRRAGSRVEALGRQFESQWHRN